MSNVSTRFLTDISYEENFAAYDRLPQQVKELLWDGPVDWSAAEIKEAWRKRAPSMTVYSFIRMLRQIMCNMMTQDAVQFYGADYPVKKSVARDVLKQASGRPRGKAPSPSQRS
jgi:hypothetical protein